MPEKRGQGIIEVSSNAPNQEYIDYLTGLFGKPSEATIPLFRGEEGVVFQWGTEDNGERTSYHLGLKRTLNWFSASPFYVRWIVTRGEELVGAIEVFSVTSMHIDNNERSVLFNGADEKGEKVSEKLFSPRDTIFDP